MRLLCKLKDKFVYGEQIIYLNEKRMDYNETHKVVIYNEENNIYVQLQSKISFLYSSEQTLDMVDSGDTYSLRFKKGFYNKEPLMLYDKNNLKKINLDCSERDTELYCEIKKDKMTLILSKSGERFYVSNNKFRRYITYEFYIRYYF